eukprot:TRINITY_DN36308_c2_g1_i2.p4 TRINITY_DN36308_c2_g1~~TRINITY_DN36308_c2_g1_i2.p4  ORF type:complete len:104 (+),score=20.51 TRINITY_DN36308_c2_g1_i2:254-565(+)
MPFMFVAAFNCLMLFMRLAMGGPFLMLSLLFQAVGTYFAYRVHQICSAEMANAGLDGQASQTQPLNQAMYPQPGPASAGPPSSGSAREPNFQVFQGSGQRLGG